MSSGFHLPGSFSLDQGVGSSGAFGAAIFRPPLSPSPTPSSYNLVRSTGSLFSDASATGAPVPYNAKRKRPLPNRSVLAPWGCRPADDDSASMTADQQDSAFGHDRERGRQTARSYTLAGQIDTVPFGGRTMMGQCGTGMSMQGRVDSAVDMMEDSGVYSDVEYRRAMGSKRQRQRDDEDSPVVNAGQARLDGDDDGRQDSAGTGEQSTTNPDTVGWSSFALHTLGGVVGKMWEFCKNGGFRGFYAGGGRGYAISGGDGEDNDHDGHGDAIGSEPGSRAHFRAMQGMSSELAPSMSFSPHRREATPFYPGDDDLSTPESTPRPPPKRRHLADVDELHRNWVLVGDPSGLRNTRTSGIPRNAGLARPPHTQEPWTSSRQYSDGGFGAGRPSLGHSHAQSAASSSNSNSRRISVPVSRLDTGMGLSRFNNSLGLHSINTNPFASPGRLSCSRPASRGSHAGSPGLGPREPASFAQARSPVFSTHVGSPGRATATTRIPAPAPDHFQPQQQQQRRRQLHHSLSIATSNNGYGANNHRPSSRRSTFTSSTSPSLASFSSFSPRAPPSLVSPSSACSSSHPHRRTHSTASTATGSTRRLSPRKSTFGFNSGIGSSVSLGGRTATTTAAAAATSTSAMIPGRQAAAARRTLGAAGSIQASPRLTPEAKQLARRRLAAEREVDERVGAASAQVQLMIRQAREALGTRVEVEEMQMDEGDYYDDEDNDDNDGHGHGHGHEDGEYEGGEDVDDGHHRRGFGDGRADGGGMGYGRNGYGTGLGVSGDAAQWEDEDEVL